MHHYFYLIHAFHLNNVLLQIPIYIEASNHTDASKYAGEILSAFSGTLLEIIFTPNGPILVHSKTNEERFDILMTETCHSSTVTINLPTRFSFNLHQEKPFTSGLNKLKARVLVPGVPGSYSTYYTLK